MESHLSKNQNTVITIGTFDGVHIGHQKIIERLTQVGDTKDLEPTILTFFPHPRMILQKDANIKLINTIAEKEAILKQYGIKNLVVQEFTKAFSQLTAEEFVKDILVNKLKAKHIIIGYDHHFGKNRTANITDLKRYGADYGFTVEEITAQDINDVAVSSTKIRNALFEGDIEKANRFLGYPFYITGTVVKGKGLGKTIDFPTANLNLSQDYKLIPKQGVYAVKSTINNTPVYGMMNIGMNPTVNGSEQTIEVNFFDFSASLYDKTLKVEILHRLRDEEKFDSVEALKAQLYRDNENALKLINRDA